MRTKDLAPFQEVVAPYAHELEGFDPQTWIEDDRNIAVSDGEGNYNLFEYEMEGVYTGHTFYTKRGRAALDLGKEVLDYVFSLPEVRVIRGLTPLHKTGARWFSRKLGFQSYGVVRTVAGPCELFILDKPTFLGRK